MSLFEMDDWFDDSFFGTADPGEMHHQFGEMHRRMSGMVNSMFSGFGNFAPFGLGFDYPDPVPALEDHSRRRSSSRRSQPIVEEPDDFTAEWQQPQSYFYSSAMTSYSGPDGVTHARRKTYNSATGKTQLAEMRKIGDQAVARKREIDADGTVHDAMDQKNLNESELGDFEQRWESRRTRGRGLSGSGTRDRSRRRALK
jgi:hypothetical protein